MKNAAGTYSKVGLDELKAKAAKGAGINVAAQFFGFIFHTMSVVMLARILEPRDFGLVAMVTAFSLWFMNFGINGFTEFILQKDQISLAEISAIFWLHIFLAILLAVGFVFFGIFLVYFYSEPTLWVISAVMGTSFVFVALSTTHLALLKREMKFSSVALVELIAVILSAILGVTAAVVGMRYWAVVIRQLSVLIFTFLGVWLLCRWRPSRPRQLSSALPALKYAIQVFCNFTLGYLLKSIDKVLLGKFHGAEVLGNYDRAYHLSSMPANQLLTPLHSVALATLSRLVGDRDKYLSYYTKALSMVALLGTLAALVLTVTACDVIELLLGPNWRETGRVVMAFGPGIAPMLVYGTNSWLHLSLGFPDRWLKWNIASSILTIGAFAVASPFGGVAMAGAYSVTLYIIAVPALWYAGYPVGFTIRTLVKAVWAYFAAAALICIGWIYILPNSNLLFGLFYFSSLLIKIIARSIIIVLCYFTMIIILQRNLSSVRGIFEFSKLVVTRK